ncbi:MAG TPA: hypothetical protein VMC79_16320, partial [Rectinemataceae bacterium]|nr:hypothetical protein [Rectinemataceae bacterium]
NVTHAALSLAEALGSEETLLAGADFSYPEGKSYARGTYIYGYFGQRSRRLTPVEGLFAGFVFRNSVVTREEDEDAEGRSFGRYLTKPLMAYKAHLERFAARSSMNIVPLPGKGVAIATPTRAARTRERRPLFAPGPAHQSAATFLEGYATDLRALPEAQDPSLRYLHALSPEQRDLWTTLLPAASTLQREAGERRMAPAELLETTRSWAVKTIEDALEEGLA